LGGASFELRAGRDRFRQDLAGAIADARAAAEQIQRALSGGSNAPAPALGQGGINQTQQIAAYTQSSQEAGRAVERLTATVNENAQSAQRLAANYTQAASAARDLAAAEQAAASQASAQLPDAARQRQIAPARATAGAPSGTWVIDPEMETLAGQAAQAWNDYADAQARVSAAASGAVAAMNQTGQAAQRNVDQIRALVDVQRALNSLVTAYTRGDRVPTGAEDVAESVNKAQQALERVQNGDYDGAFRLLADASVEARAALNDVNQEIARLTGSNVNLNSLQGLINQLDQLRAQGVSDQDERALDLGRRIMEASFGEEGSENENEAQRLVALNAQAKTLTASVSQLAAAQQRLTADTGDAEKASARLANELRRQEDAAKARIVAQERGRENALLAQSPAYAGRENIAETLTTTGLNAKQAQEGVDKLQQSILTMNRLRANTEIAEGMGDIERAAELADRAMDAFTQGDRARGVALQQQAVKELREALLQVDIAARRVRESLIGIMTPDTSKTLDPLVQQGRQIQAAIRQTEQSIQRTRAPELAAEVEATREIERNRKAAADHAERQDRVSRGTRSMVFSAVQDIGYATGLGQGGELFAGVGRLSEVVQAAGLASSTAAAVGLTAAVVALGAALVGTAVVGIQFNSFLEQSRVRLEATEGSVEAAEAALEHLIDATASREFGFFDFRDLEEGEALLKRLGQGTDEQMRRIADIAAVTGKSFTDTATQVGYLYDQIQNGQPIGDMVRSLGRAGVLTGEWTARLLAAQQSGASAAEMAELLDAALARYSGTAEKMGQTTTASFQRAVTAFRILAGEMTDDSFNSVGEAAGKLADTMADPRLREAADVLGKIVTALSLVAFAAPAAGVALGKFIREATGLDGGEAQVQTAVRESGATFDQGTPIGEARYEITRQAIEQGRQTVDAYAQGFDERSRTVFANLTETFERGLSASMGGELSSAMQATIAGQINPLLAELTAEIQENGSISESTAIRVRSALGSQAQKVLELAQTYADLRIAVDRATEAEERHNQAQRNLTVTQQTRAGILAIDQQAIDDAAKIAAQHREDAATQIAALRDQIATTQDMAEMIDAPLRRLAKGLRDSIEGLQEANQAAAQAARAVIQGQQDALNDYQTAVNERRRAAQEELDRLADRVSEIQDRLQEAREASTQHAEAFNAVINGTVDLFNIVNRQQDEITRKIIEKWEAEIGGARRARLEAEQQVDQDELANLELQLQYNRRIQAAREAGRESEARALERDRDRVLQSRRQQGQVARDEAELARRREEQAKREAQQAAQQQAATDKAGEQDIEGELTAAEQELEAARDLEEERQKQEDAEIRRRQAEIAHLERVERDRAQAAQNEIDRQQKILDGIEDQRKKNDEYFTGQIKGYNGQINAITRTQAKQAILDQQRINDAKTVYDADKKYWDARVLADQQAVTDSKAILDTASAAVTELNNQLTSLNEINTALDRRIEKEKEILNLIREQLGLPKIVPNIGAQGGGRDEHTNPSDVSGAPDPSTRPPGPPPLIPYDPRNPTPPRGYHYERDDIRLEQWWVPDGYTLADYGKQSSGTSPSPTAATPPPAPSPATAPPPGSGGLTALRAAGSAVPTAPPPAIGIGNMPPQGTVVVPGWVVGGTGLGDTSYNYNRALNGPLVSIGQVNASDPVDVDRLINRMTEVIGRTGLAAVDTTTRGNVALRGRR
jgi:hypothetical protein